MINATTPRIWETNSPEQTFELGEALGRSLVGELMIALMGPLGAGKTQLVKGIASGNVVDDVRKVTSPTFTLVHEHPGRLRLYHVDAYRLQGPKDYLRLGPEEWYGSDAVVVIEWADRVREALPEEALWIELGVTGDQSRRLRCEAVGDAAFRCLENLCAAYR